MGSCLVEYLKSKPEYELVVAPHISKHFESSSANITSWLDSVDFGLTLVDFSHASISQILLNAAIKVPLKLIIGTSDIPKDLIFRAREGEKSVILYSENFSQSAFCVTQMLKSIKNLIPKDFDIAILDEHGKHKIERPSATAKFLHKLCEENWSDINVDLASLRYSYGVSEHTVTLANINEEISISLKITHRNAFLTNIDRALQFVSQASEGVYRLEDLFEQ